MAAQPPIFIVGCQRSGTTLVRLMLDSHRNISCGPETRFLRSLEHVTDDGQDWPRLSEYGFPKEYWHRKMAELFSSIMQDYAERRGKTRWADKTPLYAMHLDYLTKLFPDALVLHVIRDAPDVVASHRSRWGWWSGLKAVEKWGRYVRKARAGGQRLGPSRYRELRYDRLIIDPEGELRALVDWLGEDWDPAVLDHENQPHDVARRYREFSAARRRSAGTAGAIYRNRLGSGRRELDPALALAVALRTRTLRRELGYQPAPGSRTSRP